MATISTEMRLIDNMSAALERIEAKMNNAARAADELRRRSRDLSGDLDDLTDEMDRASSEGMGLDDIFQALNPAAMAAAAGVSVLIGAFSGLKGAASSLIDTASHFEQMENGLSGVLQSAEKGKAMFEDLRKFSLQTTFGVDQLAGVSTQLLTLGMSTDKVKDKITQLGDLTGGNASKFNEFADLYSKVMATGKASTMWIQQASRITGVSFTNLLGKSSASAEEFDEVIKQLTTDGGMFAGSMNSAISTMEGKLGFVTDTFKELKVALAETLGITAGYKAGLDMAYNALQGIVDWLQEMNKNPIFKWVVRGVLLVALGGISGVLVSSIIPALGTIVTRLTTIAGLQSIFNPMGFGIGALVAVGATGALALYNHIRKSREEADTLANSMRKVADALKEVENLKGSEGAGLRAEVEARKNVFEAQQDVVKKQRELALVSFESDKLSLDELARYNQLEEEKKAYYEKNHNLNGWKNLEAYRELNERKQAFDIVSNPLNSINTIESLQRHYENMIKKLEGEGSDNMELMSQLYQKQMALDPLLKALREEEEYKNKLNETADAYNRYNVIEAENIRLKNEHNRVVQQEIDDLNWLQNEYGGTKVGQQEKLDAEIAKLENWLGINKELEGKEATEKEEWLKGKKIDKNFEKYYKVGGVGREVSKEGEEDANHNKTWETITQNLSEDEAKKTREVLLKLYNDLKKLTENGALKTKEQKDVDIAKDFQEILSKNAQRAWTINNAQVLPDVMMNSGEEDITEALNKKVVKLTEKDNFTLPDVVREGLTEKAKAVKTGDIKQFVPQINIGEVYINEDADADAVLESLTEWMQATSDLM